VSPARVGAERFERKYERDADPWRYESSRYERDKYGATLAALPAGRFARALELGCSIGVFSELLAPRCEQLVALDFSARALASARRRLAATAGVELLQAAFPEQVPDGQWDLVVCSEVLYYLDEGTLKAALSWLELQLTGGAVVLVVSWRGEGSEEPLRGDDVHDLIAERFARWHSLDGRTSGYRLDRFDGEAQLP
jgi:SAM-dependent methyltransferase